MSCKTTPSASRAPAWRVACVAVMLLCFRRGDAVPTSDTTGFDQAGSEVVAVDQSRGLTSYAAISVAGRRGLWRNSACAAADDSCDGSQPAFRPHRHVAYDAQRSRPIRVVGRPSDRAESQSPPQESSDACEHCRCSAPAKYHANECKETCHRSCTDQVCLIEFKLSCQTNRTSEHGDASDSDTAPTPLTPLTSIPRQGPQQPAPHSTISSFACSRSCSQAAPPAATSSTTPSTNPLASSIGKALPQDQSPHGPGLWTDLSCADCTCGLPDPCRYNCYEMCVLSCQSYKRPCHVTYVRNCACSEAAKWSRDIERKSCKLRCSRPPSPPPSVMIEQDAAAIDMGLDLTPAEDEPAMSKQAAAGSAAYRSEGHVTLSSPTFATV